MSTTQQLRVEAARKSEALYDTEKNRRPLVWGHLCDGFEAGYLAAGTLYGTALIAAQERIKNLEAALTKVAKWDLPHTGQFWDDDKTRPMSYGACYGSNGERDYMRSIANEALSPNTVKDKEDE